MKYSTEQLGNMIRTLRNKKKWTQQRLAKELGISDKQVSKYENGSTIPPMDMLFLICEKLDCELGYLLGEDDYASGTKLDTAIESELGLTSDAIAGIKKITGKEKGCLDFGYQSNHYRALLSKFFADANFPYFIDSISDLENSIHSEEDIYNEIFGKYNPDIVDKGFEYYFSSTDYEHSDEKLPEIYHGVYRDIPDYLDKCREQEFRIKVSRYDVRESFERFLESIYPTKDKSTS